MRTPFPSRLHPSRHLPFIRAGRLASLAVPWAVALLAGAALADRGALTLDVAGGGVVTAAPAPLAKPSASTLSYDGSIWLGARYALTNSIEVTATGFFEPPVTVFQNDITLVTDLGTYPGTLQHRFTRFGAQAGVRLVLGLVWRFHLGVELGWCQQLYGAQRHYDVSNPQAASDYGLQLPDTSEANLVVSPLVGLEWAPGDAWSLSVLPRAQFLIGQRTSWAVVLPLQFSWSWYL